MSSHPLCSASQDIRAATEPAPEVQRTPLLERRRREVKGDAAALRLLLGKAPALLGSVRRGSQPQTPNPTS